MPEVDQFQMPMDVFCALRAFGRSLQHLSYKPEGDLQPVSMGMSPWITGVTSIDEMPFGTNIPTSMPDRDLLYWTDGDPGRSIWKPIILDDQFSNSVATRPQTGNVFPVCVLNIEYASEILR
jgi:hypothetical protein